MQFRNTINYLICFFISILLFPAMLFTSIQLVTFHKGFYMEQYEKLNIASDIGMADAELQRVTWELLDYIRDNKGSLENVEATIKGVVRPVFNTREKDHMVDVKELFRFGHTVRSYSLLIAFILLIFIYYSSKKYPYRYLAVSYLYSAAGIIVLLSILFVLIQSNFTHYWDKFHYIFFDNDLWLLDPNTDILIQMVPEQFFYSAVTRVIAYFSIASLALGGLSYWVIRNSDRCSTRSETNI